MIFYELAEDHHTPNDAGIIAGDAFLKIPRHVLLYRLEKYGIDSHPKKQ